MKRPALTLIAFGACFSVVLAATGWISVELLRLDRAQAAAQRQAALEENVRLALWRMDSALAPLIAQESARPYFSYVSFYPPERPYGRMFNRIEAGEPFVASPLLRELPQWVLLHFQVEPSGRLTSPQIPPHSLRSVAEKRFTTRSLIEAAEARLVELAPLARPASLAARALPPASPAFPVLLPTPIGKTLAASETKQVTKNQQELRARTKALQQSFSQAVQLSNAVQQQAISEAQRLEPASRPSPQADLARVHGPMPSISEGPLAPAWVNGHLLLLRRVAVGGSEYVQGCWLDWPTISAWLEAQVKDLLPDARLVPAQGSQSEDGHLLASLPVRLLPGSLPVESAPSSPIRAILAVAWTGVLLSGAAVLALLLGALALSERRSIFVSAVTHELRTPLTTFQLYSEMLSENMVTDETQRKSYLETLRSESMRLGHLVENVLAYGRLERSPALRRRTSMAVGPFLTRCVEQLGERATRAGMVLALDPVPDELSAFTECTAVEQILANLIENACKYAASGTDRRIHLSARREGRRVALRVQDHGPGIGPADRRRLFRPFSRSAERAAGSAPGVGLGLALSRGLARSLGGELRLESARGFGASFVLTLPVG